MTMITRLGYCEKCAKKHMPKKGQTFIAYGRSTDGYKYKKATKNGVVGLTPHLYETTTIRNDKRKVRFRRICCMEGCGSFKEERFGKILLYIDELKWSKTMEMEIDNWNALLNFKDTGYRI